MSIKSQQAPKFGVASAIVVMAISSFSSTAIAQSNDAALEEITVTARMREENILDVPLTETVFTAQQIEDARIEQASGFIDLTPNVTLAQSQSAGVSFLTIRGITQVRNGEPPVATVVDGVIQINNRQFTQELFDLQSIEVVKGPQGALYGRNATGGAIIINTKQPTNEFEGSIRAGYGDGDEYVLQATASGPISEDTLLFRASLHRRDFGGLLDNTYLNQAADFTEETVFRGKLLWMPTDNFTADLRLSVARQDGGGVNFQYQPALLAPDGSFLVDPFSFASFDFSIADADLVDRNLRATNRGSTARDIDELTLKLDWDFDWGAVTSITSYNQVSEDVLGDQFPYTADLATLFGGGGQSQYEEVDAWSQELRLTSNGDSAIRWQVGAYALSTDRFISTTTSLDTGQGILPVRNMPLTDPRNPTESFLADDNDNFAWAIFGNIAYDISDSLELGVAGRYDKDEREQSVSPLNTGGVPGALNKATFDLFQPKVTLRYSINDESSVYASWGKGFRSGQFNQNGVADAAAGAGILGVEDIVPQEETTTSEIGYKGSFAGGRVRFNAAIFQTDLQNQQYFVFVGSIGAQVLVPIEEVSITGGEIDVVAQLTDYLDVFAAYGVTDGEVDKYNLNPAAVGNKSPYTADNTLNLGAQVRFPISANLNGFARIDYEKRGEQFWDPENTTPRSAIDLSNLRIGLEQSEGKWSLIGTVQNMGDEEFNSEWVLGGFAHPAPPRAWHVDFRYNF